MSVSREVRFKEYNTRRNLPAESRRKRGEANFLGAFIRTLVEEVEPPCVYARQFAVPGCGMADFLLCRFSVEPMVAARPGAMSLLAFETKLRDWKRALSQAYRYKYYADLAVVVLPLQRASRALESAQLFSALGVALWTFDVSVGTIRKHVCPFENGALNPAKRLRALAKIESRIGNLRNRGE